MSAAALPLFSDSQTSVSLLRNAGIPPHGAPLWVPFHCILSLLTFCAHVRLISEVTRNSPKETTNQVSC